MLLIEATSLVIGTALTSQYNDLKFSSIDPSGNIYVVDYDEANSRLLRIDLTGVPSIIRDFAGSSTKTYIVGISVNNSGVLYSTESEYIETEYTSSSSSSSSSSGASFVNTGNTSVNVTPGTFVNPMQQCAGYGFARGWRYSHTGVDLTHSSGCWIVSAGSGRVLKAGWCAGGMGFCTIIQHDNGYQTAYLHGQGNYAVRAGQRVGAGQKKNFPAEIFY